MRSDAVASGLEAGDPCTARAAADDLQQRTIAAVNSGRVPPRYQEELLASVTELAASIECVRTPPPAPEPAAPPADDVDDRDDDEGRDEDEDDGKGKQKGKDEKKDKKGKRK